MKVKLVKYNEFLAFRGQPVISKSLTTGSSKFTIDIDSMSSRGNSASCIQTSSGLTINGYPPDSLALPLEITVETESGVRLFRGFFSDYTSKYTQLELITTLNFEDCGRFLKRKPFYGKYRGLFSNVLEQIISNTDAITKNIYLPIEYHVGYTNAIAGTKKITILATPMVSDIVIVGTRKYIYVTEAPTTDFELNVETDLGLVAEDLAGKINAHTEQTECTAIVSGETITLTGNTVGQDFLVFAEGTRIKTEIIQDAAVNTGDGVSISVKDVPINLDLTGQYLREILDNITSQAGCRWYIDVPTGRLVIYQLSAFLAELENILTLNLSNPIIQCPNSTPILAENISYRRSSPLLDKVKIWGTNGSILPKELISDNPDISFTDIVKENRNIVAGSEVLTYNYIEKATRVVQVRVIPKEADIIDPGGGEICISSALEDSGFNYDILDIDADLQIYQYLVPESGAVVDEDALTISQDAGELNLVGTISQVFKNSLLSFKVDGIGYTLSVLINDVSVFSITSSEDSPIFKNIFISDFVDIGDPATIEIVFSTPDFSGDCELNEGDFVVCPDPPSGSLIIGLSCCKIIRIAGSYDLGDGYLGDGGLGVNALLSNPRYITGDLTNNIYIADTQNFVIRKLTPSNVITTIAGQGSPIVEALPTSGNPANTEFFSNFLALGYYNGELYFTLSGISVAAVTHSILGKITSSGIYQFILEFPEPSAVYGMAISSTGELYLADSQQNKIYKYASATLTTIAGTGTFGYSGDGGLATSAEIAMPYDVALFSDSLLYICDTGNNIIRVIDLDTGIITTVAGNNTAGFSGDGGLATVAQLEFPTGVKCDSLGNFYIADAENKRIRRVNVDSGNIYTVVGAMHSGSFGNIGNGYAAALADLSLEAAIGSSIYINANDWLYIADEGHHEVRRLMCDEETGDCPPIDISISSISGEDFSLASGNSFNAGASDGGLVLNANISVTAVFDIDLTDPLLIGRNIEVTISASVVVTVGLNNTGTFSTSLVIDLIAGSSMNLTTQSNSGMVTGSPGQDLLTYPLTSIDLTPYIGQIVQISSAMDADNTVPIILGGTLASGIISGTVTCV